MPRRQRESGAEVPSDRAALPWPRYDECDFPASPLWLRKAVEGVSYSAWATRSANQVALKWAAGESPEKILENLGRQRARLDRDMVKAARARRQEPPVEPGFGQPRDGSSNTIIIRGPIRGPWQREFARMVRHRFGPLGRVGGRRPRTVGANSYVHADGRRVRGSVFGVGRDNRGQTVFYFVHRKEYRPIVIDVLRRLRRLRAATQDEQTRLREFLSAMFGFYNAMPFSRGSSSIGRSFFAGVFAASFGRKLPVLPDAMDVRAMLLTQHHFVESFLPGLTKPSASSSRVRPLPP